MMGTIETVAFRVVRHRYTLAVLMSTVVERQSFALEFDSAASASGSFVIKIGSSDATVAIPHDAVSRTYRQLAGPFEASEGARKSDFRKGAGLDQQGFEILPRSSEMNG